MVDKDTHQVDKALKMTIPMYMNKKYLPASQSPLPGL
jgi:hypothetical protein